MAATNYNEGWVSEQESPQLVSAVPMAPYPAPSTTRGPSREPAPAHQREPPPARYRPHELTPEEFRIKRWGRDCGPPAGNKGHPTGKTWDDKEWRYARIDYEEVCKLANNPQAQVAMNRFVPMDKRMNSARKVVPKKDESGQWGPDSCLFCANRPWQPQSREADFEKTLQLQLPHQLIEAAALHVMARRREGTSFVKEDDAKLESEWKLAARIHRLATHEPKWERLLAEEYLRLQRRYTNPQIQRLRAEHKEPDPGSGPEPELDRADVIDLLITKEEKVGQVTFFSRMVLQGWRQAAKTKKAKRMKVMPQPKVMPGPIPQHSAAPNELPTFIPLTESAKEEMSRQAVLPRVGVLGWPEVSNRGSGMPMHLGVLGGDEWGLRSVHLSEY